MNAVSRQSRRHPARSAGIVALAVFSGLCLVATVWVKSLSGAAAVESIGETVTLLVALYAYMVVGVVLLARTPRNPLAWAMTGVGLLTSVGALAMSYAEYALAPPGRDLPGATLAAWVNAWWWFPTISLVFLFVPLLFPNGKPLSPRWHWLTRLSVLVFGAMVVVAPLTPTLSGDTYEIPNPVGVAAIGDFEEGAVGSVILFTVLGCTLLALVSLIIRFRRSRGVERQQMKWFVFGSAVIITMILVEELSAPLGFENLLPQSNVVFGIGVALLPITIGIAVLKYRLYDIDRIISRTLSYGLLTAVLLGLYLAAVTAITAVTAPVTRESPVGVAAATLLAAAAFGPARGRIQSVVDRRFNRARYDAGRTVDAYRTSLRDEVDVNALHDGLLAAVDHTMQPTAAVLWLRDTHLPVRSS